MSRFIEYDLKASIYDQYQKLPLSFYKQNATGDLMNRISDVFRRFLLGLFLVTGERNDCRCLLAEGAQTSS